MLTTRHTSKKYSCYELVVILHQYKKDILNVSILRASQNFASDVTSLAAFKARWLSLAINLEILCNLCTEKCENNAFEKSDTFDGWLCDFLFWRLFC